MGSQSITKLPDVSEKKNFMKHLMNDINALQIMLERGMFEKNVHRIGAEQEFCLVGEDWHPSKAAPEILKHINDPHFTTELARYNLEINLDPQKFTGDCFSKMENELRELLEKADEGAKKEAAKVILTGILPTIHRRNIEFDHMTPNPRYEMLNEMMRADKGGDFELNITGIDELITKHHTILFEACNTSFQIHLQIQPDDFAAQYNWAQAIAGPVLAAACNSPLLLGRRLWSETRIALFQQSTDMRDTSSLMREKEPRVSFGKEWLKGNAADLFKDNVSRYNSIIITEIDEDSLETLKKGDIPQLKALNLHNGTVYKWNRACYGITKGIPHLRIENRYIPSGPTVIDEIANAAFWTGLMVGMSKKYDAVAELMKFDDVKFNFFNAARTGLETHFEWFGKTIPAKKLLKSELLPMAFEGLKSVKVNAEDTERLLGIIQRRIETQTTGAKWIVNNYNKLRSELTANEAAIEVTKALHTYGKKGKPVHRWRNIHSKENLPEGKGNIHVSRIMTTDLFTVREDDLLDLVINIMDWRSIRHIPVENARHELTGLITSGIIIHHFAKASDKHDLIVKDIMTADPVTVSPDCTLTEAAAILTEKNIGCLPVTIDKKLVGLITERDIIKNTHYFL